MFVFPPVGIFLGWILYSGITGYKLTLKINILTCVAKQLFEKQFCWLIMSLVLINTVFLTKIVLPSLITFPYLQNCVLNFLSRESYTTYMTFPHMLALSSINLWLLHYIISVSAQHCILVPNRAAHAGMHTVVRGMARIVGNECWLHHLMSVISWDTFCDSFPCLIEYSVLCYLFYSFICLSLHPISEIIYSSEISLQQYGRSCGRNLSVEKNWIEIHKTWTMVSKETISCPTTCHVWIKT